MSTVVKMNLVELIQEHCTYCPEDLAAVANALLSVEDKLDWSLKYELEYVLKQYVIQRAYLDPEGLSSIMKAFPLESTTSESSVASAPIQMNIRANELNDIIKQVQDLPDSVTESIKNLVGYNSDNFSINNKTQEAKTSETSNSATNNEKEEIEEKGNHSYSSPKKKKITPVKESIPTSLKDNPFPINTEGMEELRLSATLTQAASDDGSVWRVRLIEQGHSISGRFWPNEVLQEAIPLFENARSYMNHPDDSFTGGDRALEKFVGWYDNVELKEGDGLYADWHVLGASGVPWLREQLVELSESNKLDLVGLSLLGLGKNSFKQMEGKLAKVSEGITYVRSVDLVDVPGSGGKIESMKESDDSKVRSEIMKLEELTLEELKEANPTLYQSILDSAKPEEKSEESAIKEEPIKETATTALLEQLNATLERVNLKEKQNFLDETIRESHLPQTMREALQKEFGGKAFSAEDLTSRVETYKESAADFAPYSNSELHLPSRTIVITEMERMQAAFDMLFDLDVPDDLKDTPRLSGIREGYLMVTGDYEFGWGSIPLPDDFIREGAGSSPAAAKVVGGGTVTFANVLGTSVNRRMVKQYKSQPMWWEPIVNIVSLNDLKQQDRNRMESLGALSERTTGGAEYAELTWAENVETYSPTEYGNMVPIAQRAVVNDDLRALVRVSVELGRSAGITVNEYVSNLFTQNSGNGPTLADSVQVFNNASHESNRVTLPLNRTNYATVDQTMRKFTDNSSKRIGLTPEFLLIPAELRQTALQLERSQQVPDSANRAVNIYAGTFRTIEVPQFTDANNWYLLAGPGQVDLLEMGFLNGRREPEMFVQADPNVGASFTHDVIRYKIRHRYGGDWLDYRGAIGSIVA